MSSRFSDYVSRAAGCITNDKTTVNVIHVLVPNYKLWVLEHSYHAKNQQTTVLRPNIGSKKKAKYRSDHP